MSARAAAISFAAGACLLLHAAHFDHIADDAYISLRYLDHWLRGDGLVFNPGERVMGYSNFLWLVALAPLAAIGLSLPAAAQGLGVAAAFACVALVSHELIRRHGSAWPAVAAGAWLAASAPFALWAQAGLEGPLFALWLTSAQISACRYAEQPSSPRLATAAACLVAAAWTRPEGAMYGVVIACWLGAERRGGVLRPVSARGSLLGDSLSPITGTGSPIPTTPSHTRFRLPCSSAAGSSPGPT